MHHATWIDLDSLFNCVVHNYVDSVACIFCLFCGQRLLYAQSHSDGGHAVADLAPSDEDLNDFHLPQLSVPSTPSMTEQVASCSSFSSATTTQPLNCTLVTADILCTRSGSPHNDLHSLVFM